MSDASPAQEPIDDVEIEPFRLPHDNVCVRRGLPAGSSGLTRYCIIRVVRPSFRLPVVRLDLLPSPCVRYLLCALYRRRWVSGIRLRGESDTMDAKRAQLLRAQWMAVQQSEVLHLLAKEQQQLSEEVCRQSRELRQYVVMQRAKWRSARRKMKLAEPKQNEGQKVDPPAPDDE